MNNNYSIKLSGDAKHFLNTSKNIKERLRNALGVDRSTVYRWMTSSNYPHKFIIELHKEMVKIPKYSKITIDKLTVPVDNKR